MRAGKLSIAINCGAALAHVHATRILLCARFPPAARFDSWLVVRSAIVGACIASLACAFDGPNGVCRAPVSGSLTLSRIVAPSPWCASFAVALCGGAVGIRSALESAHDASIATFVSIVLFAAFPNVGIASYFHLFFLLCLACATAGVAFRAAFGRALGANAVMIHRTHTFAAFLTGVASLTLSFIADPGGIHHEAVDLFTLSLEVASVAHIIYAYI